MDSIYFAIINVKLNFLGCIERVNFEHVTFFQIQNSLLSQVSAFTKYNHQNTMQIDGRQATDRGTITSMSEDSPIEREELPLRLSYNT